MPWWTWVSLAVFGGLVVPAGILALVETIRALRRLGRVGRTIEPLAEALALAGEEAARRGERAAASQEELQASLERLRSSLARLEILGFALEEVTGPIRAARRTMSAR